MYLSFNFEVMENVVSINHLLTALMDLTILQDHVRSGEDLSSDKLMSETWLTILSQSSEAIYDSALRKVKSAMVGKILETQVSGHLMASLCQTLVIVDSKKGLAAFLPSALDILNNSVDDSVVKNQVQRNKLCLLYFLVRR